MKTIWSRNAVKAAAENSQLRKISQIHQMKAKPSQYHIEQCLDKSNHHIISFRVKNKMNTMFSSNRKSSFKLRNET